MTQSARRDTANVAFKSRYARNLEIALGAGLLVHLLLVAAVPPIDLVPYRLREVKPFEGVDIPDEVEVLPAPEEIARPVIPTEIDVSDTAPPDATMEPMTGNPFDEPVFADPAPEPEIFRVVDTMPVVLKPVVPDYPSFARAAGAEGRVWVEVFIDTSGRVYRARVIESETLAVLDEAAVRAALRYLFSPGRQRGQAVPVRVVIPFEFRLQ